MPEALPGQAAAARARIQTEAREAQFRSAWPAADDASRCGAYSDALNLLTPFEDLFTPSQKSKLAIARKMSGTQ